VAIRAIAEQTASVGLSECPMDKLSRTPRSRCSSPAVTLRGASSDGTEASAASSSIAAVGNAEERAEVAAGRPPRPRSTGCLGSIPEVPKVSLPDPVMMAVQQTIEFAAAAALSPEPQKGIGAFEKQNAQDRDDDVDYDDDEYDDNDDVFDDTASSEGSQESRSSIHPNRSADKKKIGLKRASTKL